MPQAIEVHGEPSVAIASQRVQAWITLRGAHIAPVTFHDSDRTWQPYSLAPWRAREIPGTEDLIDVLRGDFWCLPFGAQPDGPAHGRTACGPWTIEQHDPSIIRMTIDAHDVGARVTKTVQVRDSDTALYQQFAISGAQGAYPYGTHAILDFSAEQPGSVRLSTSTRSWASVLPEVYADPSIPERQCLLPGATFEGLDAIPTLDGGMLDLSRYPTPTGHEDLVMLVSDPQAGPIAWSAASTRGRVWFSLRLVRDFPSTVLWITNGGRPQPPWNGRHIGRIGIEDVCSYFHLGLEPSRADLLAHLDIPTTRMFTASATTTLRIIQAVAFAGEDFGSVQRIDLTEPGSAVLVDDAGRHARAAVDWQYLLG